jgi:hypothetical protein
MIPVTNNSPLVATMPEVYFICKAASGMPRTKTPWRWGSSKVYEKVEVGETVISLLPKSNTAADGVIGTTMKRRIHRHPTNLDLSP